MNEQVENLKIDNEQDLLRMLDGMLRPAEPFWNKFYQDRSKGIPFFHERPDEHLKQYFETGLLHKGRVLDLGCGNGRNAVYLAQQGCRVEAIDLSTTSIAWAREMANKYGVDIQFTCQSVYDLELSDNYYDLVNDGGCLHHIPPHRRIGYIGLIKKAVKPGGYFSLDCFRPGFAEGGSELADWEVYREKSMKGGLAYSRERLLELFGDVFEIVEFRPMKELSSPDDSAFGKEFLWAILFRKKA